MSAPTDSLYASRLYAAVERIDITPPVGMYNRMWGAAKTDVSTGVHRPITATVLALRESVGAPVHIVISIDWCITPPGTEFHEMIAPVVAVTGDLSRILFACTHTHGVGFLTRDRSHLPGGEMIVPYMDRVRDSLGAAATRTAAAAAAESAAAVITWRYGRCDLATERDLPDPDAARYVTGYHPGAPADDTLLVARLSRESDGTTLASMVNYACHPTTMAWENTLYTPDFIGAMREVVEADTDGAPCLFLQGNSGELAPAHQYVGDPAVPDGHGRRLGHAVLATIGGMTAPGQRLSYQGVMESGAPLAVWRPEPVNLPGGLTSEIRHIPISMRPLPSVPELEATLAATTDRTTGERIRRKIQQVQLYGGADTWEMPAWCWQIGPVRVVALGGEPYSHLQQWLRAASTAPVASLSVTNGWSGYFPPADHYTRDQYSVWQTPFAEGSLERIRDALIS